MADRHHGPRRSGRPVSRLSPHVAALLVLTAVAALAVAGCGASDDPLASHRPSPTPTPTDEPSVFPHAVPGLEARLPKSIGSTPLTAVSLEGPVFIGTGNEQNRAEVNDMLGRLGRSADQMTIAQAADPTGFLTFQEGIIRVVGTKPEDLLDAWLGSQATTTNGRLVVTDTTVAGRAMKKVVDPNAAVSAPTYVTPEGDSLFLIRADDLKLVEEAVREIR